MTEHDANEFCATPLYKRISLLVSLFFSETCGTRGFVPNRIYTNAMGFGDHAHMHRDSSGEANDANVTALLYPNPNWDSSYAGETVMFTEDSDATEVIQPRPGRLLLFRASVQHVGRPPSRLFWGQRFTLAIKFVAGPKA